VIVSEGFLQKIFEQDKDATLTVDVKEQTITIDATGEKETFELNTYKKTCLLTGMMI